MKKLLSTTAMLASIAFATSAYAADVYEWTDGTDTFTGTLAEYNTAKGIDSTLSLVSITEPNEGTQGSYESTSLLDDILADAADLSASLSNISQNLNDIDGSIDVTTSRDFGGLVDGMGGLLADGESFGSFSQAGANVFGRDVPATLLAVLDPLTLELGDLATTAIGTLQSGNMTGSFDADGLVSTVTTSSTSDTTSANAAAEQYAGIADTIAMQNISVNTGAIDGSVALILADVNTLAGGIATTAIGALQSGAMEATIAGNMGSVSENTSDIVQALVGTGAI